VTFLKARLRKIDCASVDIWATDSAELAETCESDVTPVWGAILNKDPVKECSVAIFQCQLPTL
jgi:hypothetical protein